MTRDSGFGTRDSQQRRFSGFGFRGSQTRDSELGTRDSQQSRVSGFGLRGSQTRHSGLGTRDSQRPGFARFLFRNPVFVFSSMSSFCLYPLPSTFCLLPSAYPRRGKRKWATVLSQGLRPGLNSYAAPRLPNCLLPTAFCLLPSALCLLPSASGRAGAPSRDVFRPGAFGDRLAADGHQIPGTFVGQRQLRAEEAAQIRLRHDEPCCRQLG